MKFHIRDIQKRQKYVEQAQVLQQTLQQIHTSTPKNKFGVHQWTGQDIFDYFTHFEDFDMTDFEPQILFEKRSSGDREKFPSHISFPGGKPEPRESILDTAIRETYEETNLNLSDYNKFVYCGEYPATFPFMTVKDIGDIYVKAFVFIQISFEIIPITVNPGEIDDCIWTSLEYFESNDPKFFEKYYCPFFPGTPIEFTCELA